MKYQLRLYVIGQTPNSIRALENLKRIVELSAEAWETLAIWGSETNSLQPSQRKLAFAIAKAIRLGSIIKPNHAEEAVIILNRADELGFHLAAS